MIRSCKQFGEDLAIVTFGPLTTIAVAYLLDKEIKNNIGMISIYGGQYLGVGDTLEGLVEQNFSFDPHAASIVI